MNNSGCLAIATCLTSVVRAKSTTEGVDDCLDLFGVLDCDEKRDRWRLLSQQDPVLKQLKIQNDKRRATA